MAAVSSVSSLQGLPGERGVAGPEGKPVSGAGGSLVSPAASPKAQGPVCPGGVQAVGCVRVCAFICVPHRGQSWSWGDLYLGG